MTTIKSILKSVFLLQRQKVEKAMIFHRSIHKSTPKDELWKIVHDSPFYDTLDGLLPSERQYPAETAEVLLNTIDEYLRAIEKFDNDQLAAFLMGMGVNWMPFRYYGLEELNKHLAILNKSIRFHQEIQSKTPVGEQWKLKRGFFEIMPDLAPQEERLPAEVIDIMRQIVEGTIKVLSARSF
jgi:hypothetical protein